MIRLTALLAAAAVLALSASACGITFEDGPYTQENRDVGDFDQIEVHGSAEVIARSGPGGVLTVKGPRNRVAELTTRVDTGTLVIEAADSSGVDLGDGHVTVIVRAPPPPRFRCSLSTNGVDKEQRSVGSPAGGARQPSKRLIQSRAWT